MWKCNGCFLSNFKHIINIVNEAIDEFDVINVEIICRDSSQHVLISFLIERARLEFQKIDTVVVGVVTDGGQIITALIACCCWW